MEWANRYVGIPYLFRGLDRTGIDCYGLLRLVYREQLGIELPAEQYVTPLDAADVIEDQRLGGPWNPITDPGPYDIAIVQAIIPTIADRHELIPSHLSIWLSPHTVLHSISPAGVVIQPQPVAHRITGWYAHDLTL